MRWAGRNWFIGVVVTVAALLALAQVWLRLAFDLPLIALAAVAGCAVAAFIAFVLSVLRLRRTWADLRYRWLTRQVDRAMKRRVS